MVFVRLLNSECAGVSRPDAQGGQTKTLHFLLPIETGNYLAPVSVLFSGAIHKRSR
jgi:hypothetical protein